MERLQKILAAAGFGSRRQCEQIILQGRVTVDKEIIRELGFKLDPWEHEVHCDGELVRPERKCYYLFHKPKGVVCTNSPRELPRVIDYFKGISYRLFTVGRLDKESSGLLLVTNDGSFAQKFAHPSYEVPRIYHATVRGYLAPETLSKICEGVWLNEGKTAAEKLHLISRERTKSVIAIELKEGKNREIRRLFAQLGHPVKRLMRIQFGPFKLGDLEPGCYRKISEETLSRIFSENYHPEILPPK